MTEESFTFGSRISPNVYEFLRFLKAGAGTGQATVFSEPQIYVIFHLVPHFQCSLLLVVRDISAKVKRYTIVMLRYRLNYSSGKRRALPIAPMINHIG